MPHIARCRCCYVRMCTERMETNLIIRDGHVQHIHLSYQKQYRPGIYCLVHASSRECSYCFDRSKEKKLKPQISKRMRCYCESVDNPIKTKISSSIQFYDFSYEFRLGNIVDCHSHDHCDHLQVDFWKLTIWNRVKATRIFKPTYR